MEDKKPTNKQVMRKHRNMKIKATYASMPGYKLQELADMYHCSIGTVWNVLHEDDNKKEKVVENA